MLVQLQSVSFLSGPYRHRAITFLLFGLAFYLHGSVGLCNKTESDFQPPEMEIPEGYTIEMVAGPPLVKHPMLAAFDDRGRLFVAETDGANLRKEELLETRNRFIRMLEDTDGDGKFDKSTIFADNMVMPEGALWHDGALYVISAPYLWRLEDTDDDGVADKREKLVGKFDFNGNPNLTGPYLGPCGRIYFTGGAFGYDLEDAGGRKLGASSAAGVFSCKADGTDLQIFGQGTINPVEVMFTPAGELLTTVAIFDNEGGRHDALMHWVDGCLSKQVWGKPLLPQTGHPLPAVCRWGQVAPAGLMRYRGKGLSKEYQNNIFACQFDTHQVMRVELERNGASFLPTRDEPWLTSSEIDFHPTDIFEDADGSLLMIDTGGWLYYGCPTSKIAKPNIYGAIYRLRQKGMKKIEDPRGNKLDWEKATSGEMASWLDDPRPAVRDRAIDTLARRGDAAVDALASVVVAQEQTQVRSSQARRNAVWTLSRIGSEAAREALRRGLADSDPTIRQAAVRSLGVLADQPAIVKLCQMLREDEPPVRRAAATALGKMPRENASETSPMVTALLEGIALEDNDDYLMHAQTYALIQIGNSEATLAGLASENPRVQKAALIALNQMANSPLDHTAVIPLLDTADPLLRTTAIEVITQHKEWAQRIAKVVASWLDDPDLGEENRALAKAVLITFAGDSDIQPLMTATLKNEVASRETKMLIIDALAESNLEAMPDAFIPALSGLVAENNADALHRIVTAVAMKDTDKLDDALRRIAQDDRYEDPLRVAALAIIARHGGELDEEEFQLLVDQFDEEVIPLDRIRAATALAAASLSRAQTLLVADLLSHVGPLELPVLLQRFERDSAPVVVNIDVQPAKAKLHRGVGAYQDEPQEHLAVWNNWDPLTGKGFLYLRASDGAYSGLSLSPIQGAELRPYNINRFDRLMGDFVYNGLAEGGGEHQSFENNFTISGFKPELKYDLFYYGSAYPKPNARGAEVTLTGRDGPVTKEIRGLRTENKHYEEGITHALFSDIAPQEDGTINISWKSFRDDTEGNFGILNGLSIVAPADAAGRNPEVGNRMLDGLSSSSAITSLSPERIEKLMARFSASVAEKGTPLLEQLRVSNEDQAKHLAELMPHIGSGNPQRGQEIFFGNKAACHTCHRAHGKGGEVGPELTLIGRIRTDRDLAESIVYPSSTIANGYTTFSVITGSGRVFDGVIHRESADAIHLRMADKPEEKIAREDIEEMIALPISVMPQGLEKTISRSDLSDLIAYLRTLK